MPSRRDFLSTLSVVAGVTACRLVSPGRSLHAVDSAGLSPRRLDAVGIQLYTVRREMQRDLPATLARLAEMGYREVEFAGYFGRTPGQIRSLLTQNRLTAPSTHVGYERIGPEWDRALDEAAAAGHQYVTVPWLPDDVRGSRDGWQFVADAFNRAGARARSRNLVFAYHNHDFEFRPVDGVVPYDLLLERTDPALVQFQMDVFWLVKGGGDPIEYMRRHPGRFTMLHIKDSSGAPEHRQVDVGDGTIDFGAILRFDRDQRSAVKHVFVEHDQPADAMAFARKSLRHMQTLEL